MEKLELLLEMAEGLAKARKSTIDRLDIQYDSLEEKYSAYCYIVGYKTCYRINENLTLEIMD